jgi:hypothetical protein
MKVTLLKSGKPSTVELGYWADIVFPNLIFDAKGHSSFFD